MFCQATSRGNRWVACLPRGRSGFWRTGWFPFLSVSAISMLLFYRWRACRRASCQKHMQTLDLHFRKFFRSIVSPSPCTSTALSTCFVELLATAFLVEGRSLRRWPRMHTFPFASHPSSRRGYEKVRLQKKIRGHSNGRKCCTLGMNELHSLLISLISKNQTSVFVSSPPKGRLACHKRSHARTTNHTYVSS